MISNGWGVIFNGWGPQPLEITPPTISSPALPSPGIGHGKTPYERSPGIPLDFLGAWLAFALEPFWNRPAQKQPSRARPEQAKRCQANPSKPKPSPSKSKPGTNQPKASSAKPGQSKPTHGKPSPTGQIDFQSLLRGSCIFQPSSQTKPHKISLGTLWKSWPAAFKPAWTNRFPKHSDKDLHFPAKLSDQALENWLGDILEKLASCFQA